MPLPSSSRSYKAITIKTATKLAAATATVAKPTITAKPMATRKPTTKKGKGKIEESGAEEDEDEPEAEESGAEEDEDEPDLLTNSESDESEAEVRCHLTQNTYVNYITIASCHSPFPSSLYALHAPYG
jgi:hypothetical protein